MSIEFSAIHNVVRTYQRVLNLPHSDSSPAAGAGPEQDRLSISTEAREQEEVHRVPEVYEDARGRNRVTKDETP
jgi:hypothetical protein